jgi:hypothetical protein
MSDETADRNDRIKAAMKQRETPLNKDGGAGQKVYKYLNQKLPRRLVLIEIHIANKLCLLLDLKEPQYGMGIIRGAREERSRGQSKTG